MKPHTNVDLVLVYLGNKIPRYARENLKYLRKTFPFHRIVFLGDSEHAIAQARSLKVEAFKTSNWRELQRDTYKILDHPLEFRSGFWFNTIARFFAIAEFQAVSLKPLIQIECDVFIAGNFPFASFEQLQDVIAYPMENLSQGAASILWIGNSSLSQKLSKIAVNLIKSDPKLTDMTILGRIANESLISFTPLPTIRTNEDLIEPEQLDIYSKNYAKFNGCFDALSYGMFLLGSDPKNRRGVSELFKYRSEQVLPKNLRSFESAKNGASICVKLSTGTAYQLYCLHNHSKNVKVWKSSGHKFINKRSRIMQKRQNTTYVFYPIAFISLVISKAKRIFEPGFK